MKIFRVITGDCYKQAVDNILRWHGDGLSLESICVLNYKKEALLLEINSLPVIYFISSLHKEEDIFSIEFISLNPACSPLLKGKACIVFSNYLHGKLSGFDGAVIMLANAQIRHLAVKLLRGLLEEVGVLRNYYRNRDGSFSDAFILYRARVSKTTKGKTV
ncbi:MAG: hypothetical protein HQL56_10250 [Magnetococcales bacterium]|nr:hypothetical protein [Magnetococcales bacterium]